MKQDFYLPACYFIFLIFQNFFLFCCSIKVILIPYIKLQPELINFVYFFYISFLLSSFVSLFKDTKYDHHFIQIQIFFIWWYFLRNKEERQTNQPTIVVEKPVLSVSFQQANKQCGLRGKNKELKKYIYFSWTFRDFGKKSKFNFNRIKKFEICEKLKKEILKIVQCLCVCKNFWILIFLIMVRSLWDTKGFFLT